jgi:hypothetical protein
MVSGQPYLCKVLKPGILSNHTGIEVTVIINNGQPGGHLMVKFPGRLTLQQEIFVKKFLHGILA